jgi:hypothetical protein
MYDPRSVGILFSPTAPYSIKIPISGNVFKLGKLNFSVLARDTSGILLGVDTSSININPSGTFYIRA